MKRQSQFSWTFNKEADMMGFNVELSQSLDMKITYALNVKCLHYFGLLFIFLLAYIYFIM